RREARLGLIRSGIFYELLCIHIVSHATANNSQMVWIYNNKTIWPEKTIDLLSQTITYPLKLLLLNKAKSEFVQLAKLK
uniref:hypothetical protein n=1 Tax=Cyclobacterium marinum TaxID=104 RepID=UPI0030D8269B